MFDGTFHLPDYVAGKEVRTLKTLCDLMPRVPILIPVHRFAKHADSVKYLAELREKLAARRLRNIVVAKNDQETLVSFPDWRYRFFSWQDNAMVGPAYTEKSTGAINIVTRDEKEGAPVHEDTEITFLALQGAHQYYRWVPRMPPDLNWLRRLVQGPRECSTAFSREDGGELESVPGALDKYTAYLGQSGRLVVFSREVLYCLSGRDAGEMIGSQTTALFLRFSQQRRKELVHANVKGSWLRAKSGDPLHPPGLELEDLDPVWRALYERAKKRFKKYCLPYSREQEQERVVGCAFDTQTRLRMFPYRAMVRALSWDEALATALEPWQLYVVFQEHLWETGRLVSLEDTWSIFAQLLDVHPCTDERRAELWDMAETHIAPLDPMWSTEETP